jgi:MoaA/NifB/PqqE/SkfB family radical SAM enzyme
MASAYSPLKVLAYIDQLRTAWDGLGTMVPPHIEIDPINACNHNCTFCSFRAQGSETVNALFRESDILSFERLVRLIDEAADLGVLAIQYSGGGEPTLHPNMREVIRHTLDTGLKCGMVTNGSRITDEWTPFLEGMSWIRVSLDAASPEMYETVHFSGREGRGDRIHAAWNTVRIASGLPECRVGVSYIVSPDNVPEIAQAAHLAKDAGASYLRVGAEMFYDGRGPSLVELHQEVDRQIVLAKEAEDETFKIVDHASTRIFNAQETLYDEADGQDCHHAQLVGIIGADGNLYTCCIKKYCSDGFITSILDKPLREALLGADRAKFLRGLTPWRHCTDGCFLKPKNKMVNACLGQCEHPEFV